MLAKVRRRGNPNWGKSMPSSVQSCFTEFEMKVRQLELTPESYVSSAKLRTWCERNRDRCYIPEWLLKAWNIAAEPDLSGAA